VELVRVYHTFRQDVISFENVQAYLSQL
jgi:hypothetical protein